MNLNKLNCILNLLLAIVCLIIGILCLIRSMPLVGILVLAAAVIKLLQAWVDFKKDIQAQKQNDW